MAESAGPVALPAAVVIPAATVAVAAQWLVWMQEAPSASRQAELQRWCAQDPLHQLAWDRLSGLQQQLGATGVAPSARALACASLLKATQRQARRRTLKWMAGGMAAGGLAWSLHQRGPEAGLRFQTRTGETLDLTLADGTRVRLNTATQLRVDIDTLRRDLRLVAGEVLIETAADARPVHVRAGDNTLTPLGTRFVVRKWPDEPGLLAVLEGAVAVSDGPCVEAGYQVQFGASATGRIHPLQQDSTAWMDGMFIADRHPLPEVLTALSRYRAGWLDCDAFARRLLVTGAFPTGDTDHALRLIARALALRVRYRTRYWVTLVAR